MIKKLLLLFIPICIFTSCYTTRMKNELKADDNMQKVRIGMTKEEVVSIMGDTYKVMEAKQTADGYQEVIGYVDLQNGIYRLRLSNGKVAEWDYILPPAHRHSENTSTSN